MVEERRGRCLHLGIGPVSLLPGRTRKAFEDPRWINLGDGERPKGWRGTLIPWFYEKGDTFTFCGGFFDLVFSEHFLEHLFLDEAVALLKECRRVLVPHGIVRTVVPDADLRPEPEPAGYPSDEAWAAPRKHKTRWSVYSLSVALEAAGFRSVPRRWYDKAGLLTESDEVHQERPDRWGSSIQFLSVSRWGYLDRIDSLIVDGVKKGNNHGL